MNEPGTAFRAGYVVGKIFGAVVVGILCGLIPLSLGRKRGRPALGWVGFAACVLAGLFLGLIGALPMAGVMSLVIVIAGPASSKSASVSTGAGLKTRTPAPEPYDL